jgi:hypothetical protein
MSHRAQQQQEETILFNAFLTTQPDFAGEPIANWEVVADDPPDLLCVTISGRRVSVELGEWLNFSEMTAAKGRERTERAIESALDPQPGNTSKYFEMVIYHPKQGIRKAPDESFRAAVLALIAHIEGRWPSERFWRGPQPVAFRDLARFPPLGDYLDYVEFAPGNKIFAAGIRWILPPCHVDSYDEKTLLNPLLGMIREKVDKYQGFTPQTLKTPCDEFVLVIFYNQALLYCSPVETPNFGLSQIARIAGDEFRRRPGPFSKAFLFIATEPGQQVFLPN